MTALQVTTSTSFSFALYPASGTLKLAGEPLAPTFVKSVSMGGLDTASVLAETAWNVAYFPFAGSDG